MACTRCCAPRCPAQRAGDLVERLHEALLLGAEARDLLLERRARHLAQGLLGCLVELALLLGEAEQLLHGLGKGRRGLRLGEVVEALAQE